MERRICLQSDYSGWDSVLSCATAGKIEEVLLGLKKGQHMKKYALLSVSDKTGMVDFAKGVLQHGYAIISTGGTYELLRQSGLDVKNISEVTGFPEILDGRVKTLHPAVHGGILARRGDASHMQTLCELGITPIDLVVVNLYPFQATIQKPGSTFEEAIEHIDIGGPTMVRAAAKNHAAVAVVVDPSDYGAVLRELEQGEISADTRRDLAAKAFRHTAAYDALIAAFLTEEAFPERLTLTYERKQNLRYGENPHQQAGLYSELLPAIGILAAEKLHGKELSYNNIGDADVALELVKEFRWPTAVAIKHMNPCGVGIGETIIEAYENAYAADPVSIFGGIIALNREVDEACAMKLQETFLEIIIAPGFTEAALAILMQKKNIRLLRADTTQKSEGNRLASVGGGLLVQECDTWSFDQAALTVPTRRKPTEGELEAAKFAWTVVKYVKSNAIVLAKENRTVGIGPGQTNRVGAAKIAIAQAGALAEGAVLASDAFFPMSDTVEEAAKAGVRVIIQPGGSVKDAASIEACDAHDMAMIFTGVRHFKH